MDNNDSDGDPPGNFPALPTKSWLIANSLLRKIYREDDSVMLAVLILLLDDSVQNAKSAHPAQTVLDMVSQHFLQRQLVKTSDSAVPPSPPPPPEDP